MDQLIVVTLSGHVQPINKGVFFSLLINEEKLLLPSSGKGLEIGGGAKDNLIFDPDPKLVDEPAE